MSIVLTRLPLEIIGMNGGATGKRRSARLSGEGNGSENEPPAKKAKVNGSGSGTTTTVDTKQQDGEPRKAAGKKKRQEYTDQADDFQFARKGGKRKKTTSKDAVQNSNVEDVPAAADTVPAVEAEKEALAQTEPAPEEPLLKTVQKKTRRRLPTTPEREVVEKPIRRSKRISDEKPAETVPQASPHRGAHAQSHENGDRSPSPGRGRPVTVTKKRLQGDEGRRETQVMQIALPFADTPIQRRNKEMRKTSAEGHRRSSTGMRGKRASSIVDEGRGHEVTDATAGQSGSNEPSLTGSTSSADSPTELFAVSIAALRGTPQEMLANEQSATTALPHAEVPATEFYKHISADITEPRRMRSLLGWCGTRLLPAKPHPPTHNTPAAMLEFQAQQAAHVIQEELSQSLMTNGTLSDWFSRDESVPPQIPLRKKANPRNITNAAKADELDRELERLKAERAEWDALTQSAASVTLEPDHDIQQGAESGSLSPIHPEILDSPQRAIFEQLNSAGNETITTPTTIHDKLRTISEDLEFAVDQFAHGIHALSTTRDTADRVAEKSLADAATALEEREKQRAKGSKAVDQMDALRGLARVLNSQRR